MQLYEAGRKIWSSKGEAQEAANKEFIEILKVLEAELGDKPFFNGENIGYVDITLAPFYCWFYAYEICGNLSVEAECPKLTAYFKRCLEKESVSKALADKQKVYEFILQLKKMFGIE